jgi:hypothetical protein
MRRLLVIGLFAGLLVALTAGQAAGGAPTVISISPTTGPPGTEITVGYNGFCDFGSPSARIELLDPNDQVVADTGFFFPTSNTTLGTITVPLGSAPGVYTVRGTCNNQPPPDQSDTEPFTVTGESAPPPTPAAAEPVVDTPAFTG